MRRPRLLFYCQHSVGLGHLVRSMHLADGLAGDFDVTLLNGGPWPADLPQPGSLEIVHLPALGLDADYALVSRDERFTVEEALAIDTRLGDAWAVAVDECNLGTAYACAERPDDARRPAAVDLPGEQAHQPEHARAL